ncbi:MAG: DNA polymerase III subunit beta [Spirochaetales bacterium]|jgi:DNA polymerase-3 subunit beta|nr:DNA polymerase III subunit beta [Spirochaetales bacterium]
MKLKCDKNLLLKEITVAQEILSTKNALSILSNVLMEAENNTLVIQATDLKVSFETRIPVDLVTPGSCTAYGEKLLEILRKLPPGEIELELDGGALKIHPADDASIDFGLKSLASEQYPALKTVSDDSYFDVAQADLIEMISQTVFAVSDDETRYFMNGVYFENIEGDLAMVATDGRRLSYIKKKMNEPLPFFEGIIIPTKVLNLIKKLISGEGNISLAVSDKSLFFKLDNQRISSNLIDGAFPKYQRVIPEDHKFAFLVNKTRLLDALQRTSVFVENKSKKILFNLSAGKLTLKSEESEYGMAREEIDCEYAGADCAITLNCSYIMEPLKIIQEDSVQIQFTEVGKAITLNAVPEADFFHVIMPMQTD